MEKTESNLALRSMPLCMADMPFTGWILVPLGDVTKIFLKGREYALFVDTGLLNGVLSDTSGILVMFEHESSVFGLVSFATPRVLNCP